MGGAVKVEGRHTYALGDYDETSPTTYITPVKVDVIGKVIRLKWLSGSTNEFSHILYLPHSRSLGLFFRGLIKK